MSASHAVMWVANSKNEHLYVGLTRRSPRDVSKRIVAVASWCIEIPGMAWRCAVTRKDTAEKLVRM